MTERERTIPATSATTVATDADDAVPGVGGTVNGLGHAAHHLGDQAARPVARPAGGVWLAVILLVSALNLRMAVAALSPVLDMVQTDTGLSSAMAGLLSTVPVMCFGIFALATPKLIRRFGMERLLVLVMVVITAGIALRVLPPLAALFAGTAVLGA